LKEKVRHAGPFLLVLFWFFHTEHGTRDIDESRRTSPAT